MIWGAFSSKGVLPLKKIEGIMEQKMYHGILTRNVMPQGTKLMGKGFIFQQDNDPKHTAKFCQNYLQKKEKNGSYKIAKLMK